jgi:hypothetical protein
VQREISNVERSVRSRYSNAKYAPSAGAIKHRRRDEPTPAARSCFVSFTMGTGGLYRRIPQDRHLGAASRFRIGVIVRGSIGHPFAASRSRFARLSDAKIDAINLGLAMPTMELRVSAILGAFEQAQTALVGKAVILTDGKAGTVENVWLDELHGLRISIRGHDGKWPISTIKFAQTS